MIDPKQVNDIVQNILEKMPSGLKTLPSDVKSQLKLGLNSAMGQLDVVTREHFDIQAEVLIRTRKKLTALEKRVAELEQKLNN